MTLITTTTDILQRTPLVLQALLANAHTHYTHQNEGPGTWNVPQVLAHLIYADVHNWVPRIRLVVQSAEPPVFTTFDASTQFGQLQDTNALIARFTQARTVAIQQLHHLGIEEPHLQKTAIHPALGTVTLAQLLTTWATHDLAHTAQIIRIMAKQNTTTVGPWISYLSILHDKKQ